MNDLGRLVVVGVVLAMLVGVPAGALGYEVGDVVADFSFPDLAGRDPSLYDYMGGIVVLNFFATWCVGCNEEAAHLEADIWQAYQGWNVTVIAVDINEPVSLVQGWVDALEVTYEVWLAPDWDLFLEFPGALNIPYNAVIGPDMVIRYASIGFDLEGIVAVVDEVLGEGEVPVDGASWGGTKALYR